jgi:hypothetical protein
MREQADGESHLNHPDWTMPAARMSEIVSRDDSPDDGGSFASRC